MARQGQGSDIGKGSEAPARRLDGIRFAGRIAAADGIAAGVADAAAVFQVEAQGAAARQGPDGNVVGGAVFVHGNHGVGAFDAPGFQGQVGQGTPDIAAEGDSHSASSASWPGSARPSTSVASQGR